MVELEVNHNDVEDPIWSHNRGLTTEDLQELDSFIEHDSGEEEQNQDDTMPILNSYNFLLLGTLKRLPQNKQNCSSVILRTKGYPASAGC
jgi:hypothetical protein